MKHKIIIGTEILIALLVLAGMTVFANQAGSTEDPLVAKSYVDDKVNGILEIINGNGSLNNSGSTSSKGFVPVKVEVNQTLFGKEGTEIILRSGKGEAVVSANTEGIANITTGQELISKSKINKNNLLVISRDDGRGIKVTESAWFLVRGSYEIK